MSRSFFITGTDTGIGKTLVTAGLLRAFTDRGFAARPVKPVQSGCIERDGTLIAQDLEFALEAASLELSDEEKGRLCPNKLRLAASPHFAAEHEDAEISWEDLLQLPHQPELQDHSLLIEGAGGLFVPIDREHTMLDLIQAYSFPVILVARAGLGTLNHTLLSVEALEHRGCPITAIVLNDTTGDGDSVLVQDNLRTLRDLSGLPVYGPLAYQPSLDTEQSSSWRPPDSWESVFQQTADHLLVDGAD